VKPRTKAIAIAAYALVLHIAIVALVVRPDLVDRIGHRLGVPPPELTPHYHAMVAYHRRMDGSVPAGATVFIGDSLTQSLATSAVAEPSVNYGIGSDTTAGVLARLPHYASMNRAKAVVIAIGINDLRRRGDAELLANHRRIAAAVPASTKLVLGALLPVDEAHSRIGATNTRIAQINAALKALAAERPNTVFVDAGERLKDAAGQLAREFHTGDGVHLSTEGYARWIAALKPAI
jgi:lysophospholipase L1-like esterase